MAVVRGGASSLGPSSLRRPAAANAVSTPARAAVRSVSSATRIATTMSLGVASVGTSKPIWVSTSTFSGVAIATCAATTPSIRWTSRLTCSRVTESAYAPLRSSTCLLIRGPCGKRSEVEHFRGVNFMLHVPSLVRWASARRAPASSAEPEVCPIRLSEAARSASRGVPSAATYAANSGITSPWTAHSSNVADSRVVRPRAARTFASSSGVATPAARWIASQPQSTSSASGVRPGPSPILDTNWSSNAVPKRRRVAFPSNWRLGTATSSRRRIVTGVPSRCSTPSSTAAEPHVSAPRSRLASRRAQGTATAPEPTTPTQRPPTSR